jgi:hypothetical protein
MITSLLCQAIDCAFALERLFKVIAGELWLEQELKRKIWSYTWHIQSSDIICSLFFWRFLLNCFVPSPSFCLAVFCC